MVKALIFPPTNLVHISVEFIVGSFPCSEGFSQGTPVFLLLQKPIATLPKYQFDLERVDKIKTHLHSCKYEIGMYMYLFSLQLAIANGYTDFELWEVFTGHTRGTIPINT